MKSNSLPLPAASEWRVLHHQATVFWEEPQVATDQEWWQEATGGGEFETTRKGLVRTDAGEHEGRQVQLTVSPIRADWIAFPVINMESEAPLVNPPTLGTFEESCLVLDAIVIPWLESCPSIVRLSSVTKLAHFTPTREDSYAILDRCLPDVIVDPTASEFQFKINRKRESTTGIEQLVINRLCTWSSVKLELTLKLVNAQNLSQQHSIKQEFTGAMLEADINTTPEFSSPLPQDRLAEIWHELASLTAGVIANGDYR